MSAWTDHVARWKDCTKCPLHQQRDNIVLARGQIPCDVLFVGEAPGASENALGQPFVGPAGRLMDQIIERSLPPNMRYALTNLVCCFPADAKARGENEPEHNEIEACRPRLVDFVTLARPTLVVFVGRLSDSYGPWVVAPGVTCAGGVVEGHQTLRRWTSIVHPAAILRMPLAQKQMAVQKSVVVLRSAVAAMV